MFMYLARRYGLDPFNKEIWFIKDQDNPVIMTSRDGYLKIADRHSEYDGLVSDVVRENDLFKRSNNGIEHQYGKNRGRIIGAYAMVYRKDRTY
ncbi:MAG: RecT family recombinase, partial [Halanaerobiales bacterium]